MVRVFGPIPDRFAALGIAATGLAWSLGSLAAHWSAVEAAGLPLIQSAVLITLGGVAATLAIWFGIGAVAWAMARLLRGQPGFIRLMLTLSAATPPMWLVAPAVALLLAGELNMAATAALIAVVLIGGIFFLVQLVAGLRNAAALSNGRAWACIILTGIFCFSFLSLQQ